MQDIQVIAALCHENVRCLGRVFGDFDSPTWTALSQDKKNDVIADVRSVLIDPNITASELHVNWCNRMRDRGWRYGITKSNKDKVRPDLCEFDSKPIINQQELELFISVVRICAKS